MQGPRQDLKKWVLSVTVIAPTILGFGTPDSQKCGCYNLFAQKIWMLNIVFTLKMESVSKITTFGLKMMVKSGPEKIFLKFLHAQ